MDRFRDRAANVYKSTKLPLEKKGLNMTKEQFEIFIKELREIRTEIIILSEAMGGAR